MPINIDDLLKGILPLGAAIFTYFKLSYDRLRRAVRISKNYHLSLIYWLANIWPHRLYSIITLLIMLAAINFTAVKFESVKHLPRVGSWLTWLADYYVPALIVWLLFVVSAYFQIIERAIVLLLGRVPRFRESIEWANANWHVPDDSTHPLLVLASSDEGLTRMANQVIDDLVNQPANPSLALRPAGLDNTTAANILYFGHVIEAYMTVTGGARFHWTPFYQAFAEVSRRSNRPFDPKFLLHFDGTSHSFLDEVLIHINDHLPVDEPKLKSEPDLEQRVNVAFKVLQKRFQSDARNIARGWIGNSYGALLDNSESFLQLEEMRRQFAKLITIWNVVDRLHRPRIFKIPFSGGIFLMYLNSEVMLTESERFSREDLSVQLCFEETQRRLMRRVQSLLDETREQKRLDWRKNEQSLVSSRGIDWQWWIPYRSDQHTYHLGRTYEPKPWKAINNYTVFAKSKN